MAISQIYDMSARQVWVGRYDEHGSREVAWDVSPWTSMLGSEGVFALLVTRPRDTDSPYNAQVSFDATTNLVTWAVTDIDTALKGWGRAELHYYVDGALVKSQTFVTIIEKAMFAGSTAPSAAEGWVERMEQAALDAQAAAETAEDAETTATSAATTATSAAATATTAANSASSSASSARADATTATNAATAAALSESAASTAATNAAASAEAASTSALTASTAASTATTKASQASASASTAATAATTATTKASEATTAATTATNKAAEASTSASTATSAKDTAVSAASTATSKATEATTAAATAVSAKDDAVSANTAAQSAKTAAQTAQTGAETAAASVSASAAQIQTNADDISELKEDFAQVIEYDDVEKSRTETVTWNYGLLAPSGSVSSSSSYIYSSKVAVNEGDVVEVRRNTDNTKVNAIRLCAYNGDTAVPASGIGENYSFPITIGSGVTHIAVTLSAAYYSVTPYYYIKYEETEAKSKSYTKAEVDALIENAGKVKTVNNIEPDANGNIEIAPEDHVLLVTQTERITTVQKEVVQSQIDVVDSARNAANNGVLPSNDGTTNFNNLQDMLDVGGSIVVDVPGVYEINGMLKIESDTELIFGKGVFMKMMNTSGGFIVNKGASTNTYNQNIRISGLNLICNGKQGDSRVYRSGLRGKIGFGFVKNLVLDSIYCDDITDGTYFIHIAAYDNVLIQNCHIQGDKDGIHSACGEHLTIRNCYFNTKDDPIALNCQDYVASIPYYGWIKDVLIENCVDDSPNGVNDAPRARSILIYGGAWDNWASGNTYRNGDTVVASNDCVYRFISQTAISDETVVASTVEPTHLSGNVTETDGCTWHFVQDVPIYNVACENVTVRNYHVKCSRAEVFRIHNDNSQYVRSIYPTAIMPPHKNIIFDGVSISDDATTNYLIGQHEPVDNLKLINSKINATYCLWVNGNYALVSANNNTNIALIGDVLEHTPSTVLILSQQSDKVTNVKTYGNFAKGSVGNSVTNGTVNMIANDLFN